MLLLSFNCVSFLRYLIQDNSAQCTPDAVLLHVRACPAVRSYLHDVPIALLLATFIFSLMGFSSFWHHHSSSLQCLDVLLFSLLIVKSSSLRHHHSSSSTSSSSSSPSQHDHLDSRLAVPTPFSGLCLVLILGGAFFFFFLAVPSSLSSLAARALCFSSMSDSLLTAPEFIFPAVTPHFLSAFLTPDPECTVQVAAGTS